MLAQKSVEKGPGKDRIARGCLRKTGRIAAEAEVSAARRHIVLRIEPHAVTVLAGGIRQFCAFVRFASGQVVERTSDSPICDSLYATNVAAAAKTGPAVLSVASIATTIANVVSLRGFILSPKD